MQLLAIILILALTVGCKQDECVNATIAGDSNSPVFEMRLVQDSLSPDSEPMTLSLKGKDGKPTQRIIIVQKTPVLGMTDVEKTSVWGRADVVGINITLTNAARKRFDELTRKNIGRHVAIMIDGRLRDDETIMSEISSGDFDVLSDWSPEEAKLIAKKIEQASKSRNK
ncbi:MAG: hypothetical protein WAO02_12840 [Verrucomicrobiia bacterium]